MIKSDWAWAGQCYAAPPTNKDDKHSAVVSALHSGGRAIIKEATK